MERTFAAAWLSQNRRRMSKDYERLPESSEPEGSEAFVYVGDGPALVVRRLARA